MSMRFRADNIGSLLGPAELLQARADYGEERIDLNELRQVEDRAILMALNMQRATGIEVFTDGEYRRGMFTADITQAVEGFVRQSLLCSQTVPRTTEVLHRFIRKATLGIPPDEINGRPDGNQTCV